MVRDYYYAQGIYELLKKDFSRNDRFFKYLGGVHVLNF
jgi:hypothetical protein